MHDKQALVIFMFFIFLFSTVVSAQSSFIRGDSNQDSKVDISDSVFIYNYLFQGGTIPKCEDAADINDDGKIDITDPVYLNNYLYKGGPKPPTPYSNPGNDPTTDDLGCGPEGQGGQTKSKCGGLGIDGACKKQSMETNEGPGGEYCTYSNYEECCDYKTKSKVRAYGGIINPGKVVEEAIDDCKDSQILREAYLNCPILTLSSDSVGYVDKDCNDFNRAADWGDYYCDAGKVQRDRIFYDYDCVDGACKTDPKGTGLETEILSELGDDDYCTKKKDKCGVGCAEGEYDCDFNSQCDAGLVCKGPLGGAADGCCKQNQEWDTIKKKCVACSSGDGPCCGADGEFKPSEEICENDIGVIEYSCKEGRCVGDDVWKRTYKRYCRGNSAKCDGRESTNEPTIAEDCTSNEFCDGLQRWTENKMSCSIAQCTEGVCCNNKCGAYQYKDTKVECDNPYEEGCPQGIDLGIDARKRRTTQYCSGDSNKCTGRITRGDWIVKEECSDTQYCDLNNGIASCKNIACSQNLDCGKDGFIDEKFCKKNNIWDRWIIWTCDNAGTKESSCKSTTEERSRVSCDAETVWKEEYFCQDNDIFQRGAKYFYRCNNDEICENIEVRDISRLREICQNGCETLSPINARCRGAPLQQTCLDNIKNQDESDTDCGGSACNKCSNEKSCKLKSDCQSDYCNPSTSRCESPPQPKCQNECSQAGATQCISSTTRQTCGNHDSDSCLEWGGEISCQFGCANNQCQADQNQPDLTISALVKQFPIGNPPANQNIVLGFTIENKGKTTANNVFWNAITGTNNFEQSNKVPLLINTGKSATVFILTSYSKAGTYTATITTDPNNKIEELDEKNNEKAIQITVV